jgi:hypothetical protein
MTGAASETVRSNGASPLVERVWSGLPRSERLVWIALALASLVLRAFAFFNYRFDSDEPQHLHVAWGWTRGLIQYRDLFDNHAPLFQMLTAPILALVGERPDVLLYMRLPMLPLFVIVVGATYVLAWRLYSKRIALWAALILSLNSSFLLKSLEYRTDNLWNAVWMVALVVLTAGAMTSGRMFFTGLLLGIALCVSLKTTLLVISMGGAGLITYSCCLRHAARRTSTETHRPMPMAPPIEGRRPSLAQVVRLTAVGLAGFAIVPAVVSAYFVWKGAWSNLVYCNFTFHELVARTRDHVWLWRSMYPIAIGLLIHRARVASCGREFVEADRWRFFFAVLLAVYVLTLGGFWMIILMRDFLPVMPMATIFIVAAVVDGHATRQHAVPVLAGIGLLFVALTIGLGKPFQDQTRAQIAMTRQVLGLTRPGETIIDLKGETIFRPRPVYQIFESITRAAIRKGLIHDTIPESIIDARCHVALPDSEFIPHRARNFLRENFLDVGRLRAAGRWIAENGSFSIAVEGPYVILTQDGQANGLLDGTPYNGPRMLQRGVHNFSNASDGKPKAVLWAPAFTRGYSPFHLRDQEG